MATCSNCRICHLDGIYFFAKHLKMQLEWYKEHFDAPFYTNAPIDGLADIIDLATSAMQEAGESPSKEPVWEPDA